MQIAGAAQSLNAQSLNAQSLNATRPPRHLERIGSEADRVNRLSYVVQEFLDRFHGVSPEAATGAGDPIQISYRNDIDRLSANLDTLDARIQALSEIG